MTGQRVKGIILRRKNIGEADRLYSILTTSRGKIVAKARGARKVTSRQSGHLEPFYVTSFLLVSTRRTQIISQALVEESFPSIYGDLKKIAMASYFAELVDNLTEEHQPVAGVFELLLDALTIIEQSDPKDISPLLPRLFELKLMSELGYRPELDRCVVGEEKYSSLQAYQFSVALGGLVCPDHQKRHPGQPLSNETIHLLREIIGRPLRTATELNAGSPAGEEAARISRGFLEYHLSPKLKSPKVVKDLQD